MELLRICGLATVLALGAGGCVYEGECTSGHARSPESGQCIPEGDGGTDGDGGIDPDGDVPPDSEVPCEPVTSREVDILLMIDNSGSMTEEQASLAAEIPRMIRVLTSGSNPDTGLSFAPSSVRVGVISSDMGTGSEGACFSTFGDDGVLVRDGGTGASCMEAYPQWLDFADDTGANDATCLMALGTLGCGFEQQLDAMLKALATSDSGLTFTDGSLPHGDGANAGFLREDSVLVLIALTDEDDCSATDPALFVEGNPMFDPNLNLRCFNHPEVLHPTARYRDGLLALRSERPGRLVYAPIVGVPTDLVPSTTQPLAPQIEAILADARMVEMVNPMDNTQLVPSCDVPGRGRAFPPRRMLQVAAELDEGGARGVVSSICQESLTEPMNDILASIASALDACR